MNKVIARLEPSLGRRWFGVISLCVVALISLFILITSPPPSFGGKFIMFVVIGLLLWQAQWNLRVTRTGISLTKQGLFDDTGHCLCLLDNILQVDRGLFAFRPANGFLIHMERPEPAAWAPGLYWRIGRRMGVGGATKSHQAKAMADAIDLMLHERAMGTDIPG